MTLSMQRCRKLSRRCVGKSRSARSLALRESTVMVFEIRWQAVIIFAKLSNTQLGELCNSRLNQLQLNCLLSFLSSLFSFSINVTQSVPLSSIDRLQSSNLKLQVHYNVATTFWASRETSQAEGIARSR